MSKHNTTQSWVTWISSSLLFLALTISANAVSVSQGDVNSDGQLTVLDLVKYYNHISGEEAFSENTMPLADLNSSGMVDNTDVATLLDAILGQTTLPELQVPAIEEIAPSNGEEMVGITRLTVVRFDEPIDPDTVTTDSFYLIANGLKISGSVSVSSTEKFATFRYVSPLPASTEVRIIVEGDKIFGRSGLCLDADGNGIPGGTGTADFRTVPNIRIPGTDVFGRVIASEQDSEGNDVPLEGVTLRVEGFQDFFAVTDANGDFTLEDVPAPIFFVLIDGSTTTFIGGEPVPENGYFPTLGKPFHSVPGQAVALEMEGEPFDIHLPFILNSAIHEITPGEAMTVSLPVEQTEGNPDLALVSLTIPADSLINFDGTPGTQVGVFQVASDRLPAPLPGGLTHTFDVTVQADAGNFNEPAPITFPNTDGLAPGEKSFLMSFDHFKGEWIIVGTMTVSEDGLTVTSDPGVGVRAPGWHGVQSGSDVIRDDRHSLFVPTYVNGQGAPANECPAREDRGTLLKLAITGSTAGFAGLLLLELTQTFHKFSEAAR